MEDSFVAVAGSSVKGRGVALLPHASEAINKQRTDINFFMTAARELFGTPSTRPHVVPSQTRRDLRWRDKFFPDSGLVNHRPTWRVPLSLQSLHRCLSTSGPA